MNFLAENIRYLRKTKSLTQAQLAAKLNVNRSLIGAYEEGRAEPRLGTLQVLCLFFKVKLHELVNEDLQRNTRAGEPEDFDIQGKKLRILPVMVDASGEEQIPLLPQKAAAGYTRGYSDMEFIENLTTAHLPFPELPRNRTYRIFQIEGDSMLPVQAGSYIIGEYVDDWYNIKDHECYVLLSKDDGIVYKRLINEIREKEGLTLRSDNSLYAPYFMPVSNVLEVWRARGILNFSIPDGSVYAEQLNQKVMESIGELKSEIKALAKKIH